MLSITSLSVNQACNTLALPWFVVPISCQNMVSDRKWSMQQRLRAGYISLGSCWSSPDRFPSQQGPCPCGCCVLAWLWTHPNFCFLFLYLPCSSRHGIPEVLAVVPCPPIPSDFLSPLLSSEAHLEPSVPDTVCSTHKRATGQLTNITATILNIYSHITEHLSQFKMQSLQNQQGVTGKRLMTETI